jgi:hypothetical protein
MPVAMRAAPSITFASTVFVNAATVQALNISSTGFNYGAVASAGGPASVTSTIEASIEL